MKTNCLWLGLLLFLSCFALEAQEETKYTLSGQIRAAASNESLIAVTVFIPELNTGVSTNKYGFYSVSLQPGTYTLEVSSIGYRKQVEIVELNDNLRLDIFLEPFVEELDEIVIIDFFDNVDQSNNFALGYFAVAETFTRTLVIE